MTRLFHFRRGNTTTHQLKWAVPVCISVLAVGLVWSVVLSDDASLRLHIGTALLGTAVHRAWFQEAVPYTVATGCSMGVVWFMPKWGNRAFQVVTVLLLASGLSLWLALQPVSYSMDLYRYVWDGRLLVHGISPYSYVPADPHLVAFRNWPYWHVLAWKQWPEAYPPVAQAYFWFAAWISHGNPIGFKLMFVLNGLLAWVLFLWVLVVRRRNLRLRVDLTGELSRESFTDPLADSDVRAFALFALFPPFLMESFGAGHVDILAVPWLLLAWLGALRRSPVLLGAAMALATGIKLYPVVLFAAFLDWRSARKTAVSFGVFVVSILVIGLSIYPEFHGFLAYYQNVSQLDYNGSIEHILVLWFGSAVDTHSTLLIFLVECFVWWVVLFSRARGLNMEQKASILGLTFFLASPLLHPWYLVSIVPFAIAGLDLATLWLCFSSHLTYDEVLWDMYIEYVPTYALYIYRMASVRLMPKVTPGKRDGFD